MSNALARETSPYLLQHADNPVAWLPWGEEAFARARREDKPVFLSVGYAACHWCHVMAHESFEDTATASLLNEHFVPVKVDREERPDIDALYMDAVVSLTGQGGWPMSVFLTPEARPFYGGTYFPPAPRHGLPSFREVLLGVHRAWVEDRERLLQSAGQLSEQLAAASAAIPAGVELRAETLVAAADALWRSFDGVHGGWGGAPKFPSALAVEFLFRRHVRTGDPLARDLASQTLESMAAGGIYDQLGGGFHRYSVDAAWTVPHFEKMLYDNALLARAYLIGWQVTRNARLLEVARGTLDFLQEEMALPDGGLASSIDADSDGEEGKYYVWTEAEVLAALGDPDRGAFAAAVWGITPQGNFEGSNVLIRAADDTALEARFGQTSLTWRGQLEESRKKLLAARRERTRPTLDDKALTAWNGLALWSFAEAARVLGSERYRTTAQSLAAFLLERPWLDGELARSWRVGEARHRAYLEDHAALGLGLLALYQTDFNPRWYTAARQRADEILAAFSDPAGGFYDTRHDHEPLLARPRSLQDSPVPSGSTMAAILLLQLAALTGESLYDQAARRPMEGMQAAAAHHPSAFAGWLCAIDFGLEPPLQLAVVGPREHQGFESLLQVANSRFRPGLVMAAGAEGVSEPPLLRDRKSLGGVPTAYLCRQFTCDLPTTSAKELADQISQSVVPSTKA